MRLFLGAGLPPGVLQLLPGDGKVGARLVANPTIAGVVFTGSTEAARSINKELSKRGRVPFIAETGGQNILIADSSSLPEQLVNDAITSAFDSAGQRCSALRVLCLQEDIADRVAADAEGRHGGARCRQSRSPVERDVGPVISAEAQKRLTDHIARDARERPRR